MSAAPATRHAQGVAMCIAGILLLSPEAMIIRLVGEASTADILFYRSLLMGLSLAAFIVSRAGARALARLASFGTRGWLAVSVRSLLNIGFVASIQNTSVANTMVILATMPAFAALLSWLIIGEKASLRNLAMAGIAFLGVGVIFWHAMGSGGLLGDSFALGTAILYALYIVLVRRESLDFMLYSSCLSSLISAMLVLPFSAPLAVSAHDLTLLVPMGLFMLPAAFGLLFAGARLVPPVECGVITLLEVVTAPLWVWIAIGEEPSAMTLIGGTVIVGAIAFNSCASIRGEVRARRSAVPAVASAPLG